MDSFLANYLYTNDPPFIIFGLSHILGLVVAILLAVYLPLYAKRHLAERKQNLIGSTLGWLVAGAYLSWAVLEMFAGTFSVKLHLPFHLCRAANLLLPLVMEKEVIVLTKSSIFGAYPQCSKRAYHRIFMPDFRIIILYGFGWPTI